MGYLSLEKYLQKNPSQKGIFLETAHPVKFYDAVEPVISDKVPIPPSVQSLLHKPKKRILIDVNYQALRDYLLAGGQVN